MLNYELIDKEHETFIIIIFNYSGIGFGWKKFCSSKTKEVAISDSYAKGFEERWLTEEEKEAIGGGYFWIISW